MPLNIQTTAGAKTGLDFKVQVSGTDAAGRKDVLEVWQQVTGTDAAGRKLVWRRGGSGTGLFVAVGYNCAMTSLDGITWASRTVPSGNWRSVCYAPDKKLFVAVGTGISSNMVMTSPDGVTWTVAVSDAISGNGYQVFYLNSVCYAPDKGLFMAIGGERIVTSTDGKNWTVPGHFALTGNGHLTDICYLHNRGKFAFIGVEESSSGSDIYPGSGSGSLLLRPIFMMSESGTTVSSFGIDNNIYLNCIGYHPTNGQIFAGGERKAISTLLDSSGAPTASWVETAIGGTMTSACYSQNQNLLVGVTNGSTVNISSNAEWWSFTTAPSNLWTSVCYAEDKNLFAAVSGNGSGTSNAMTSAVGTSGWTSRTTPAGMFNSVCYGYV